MILGVRVLPNVFVRIVCDLSVMLYGVFCVCVFCVSVCACVSTKWLCVFVCELLCVFVCCVCELVCNVVWCDVASFLIQVCVVCGVSCDVACACMVSVFVCVGVCGLKMLLYVCL